MTYVQYIEYLAIVLHEPLLWANLGFQVCHTSNNLSIKPSNICTYWPVLGSFNNCNILKLSHKAKSSEEIDKINQVLLDVISENISALVQTGKYDAINKIDANIMG